jgi:CRP/FNR family cyclic AMP-dependent transcriptional regulator
LAERVKMAEEREVKLLSLVDILQPLSEEELRELAQRCSYISVRRGEDFYRPEIHNGGLFLILEGRVRVYLITSDGKEVTLDMLGSGTVLWGRRLVLVDDQAVYAQAVEQTELAFMGREDLDRLILKKPEVGLRLMELLARRLDSSNERMAEVSHKEILSRLASQILRLLEGEGVVDQQRNHKLATTYTHERLGTMIGAGRPAVTRAFGQLQEEGVLELRRRRIYVRDLEALRRIAEQGR